MSRLESIISVMHHISTRFPSRAGVKNWEASILEALSTWGRDALLQLLRHITDHPTTHIWCFSLVSKTRHRVKLALY
jgi:hypothetical protein